jgi:hypothetical protein
MSLSVCSMFKMNGPGTFCCKSTSCTRHWQEVFGAAISQEEVEEKGENPDCVCYTNNQLLRNLDATPYHVHQFSGDGSIHVVQEQQFGFLHATRLDQAGPARGATQLQRGRERGTLLCCIQIDGS